MRWPALLILVAVFVFAACTAKDPSDPATPKRVLVTGATGTQGGAVARELLKRGYAVRGLTRNPDSERATALTELGIEMVRGNFDDKASLTAAMQDAYGVFAVTNFWEHGYDGEVSHGRNLIDAASESGVKHFVFTSVASADQQTGLAHFDSKYEIEKYLAASGLDYTVVRPVEFLDNLRFMREEIMAGSYVEPRAADKTHQWIAVRDIGFFVGEALDNPQEWLGRTEDIAGVEMSIGEFIACLEEVTSIKIEHVRMSWADFEEAAGEEMTRMNRWFDDVGYAVDIGALREAYPSLTTLEQYLRDNNWQPQ